MRWLIALLTLVALSGCVEDAPDDGIAPEPFPLQVYRHAWEGSDVFVAGVEHGLAFTVSNPTERDVSVGMFLEGTSNVLLGPIGETGGKQPIQTWLGVRIDEGESRGVGAIIKAGESTLFLGKVTSYESNNITARFLAADPLDADILYEDVKLSWTVAELSGELVTPTTLVQTRTVGLWTNGTSFYTNSAELLSDPKFPAGGNVDRAEGTDTLPIFVYNVDRYDQPVGNADNCYFTTIAGYNGLLSNQAEHSTGITLMQPSQGYTQEGNEGHLLFGEALVFMNTIVAIDGQTGVQDELPNPNGACFDPTRIVGKAQGQLPF